MGVTFPCFAINTTNITSFVLTLLFNLVTRFTYIMLEKALIHLGLVKPTEEAFSGDHDHQYPTDSVPSLVLDPVQVAETTTVLLKNSLPEVEYGDFVGRFKELHEDVMRCIICLNYVERSHKIRELRCCHVFHRECLDAWVNKDQLTCPLCRSAL
ncbi:hypothetical protein PTKIN_Ptkin05aG0081300 [Pterospermum kingtungense]